MPQRLLNQTQMDAKLHQVRGMGVPKRMNVRLFGNTALLQRAIKGSLQALAGDRCAGMFRTARRKKPIGRAVSFPKLTQASERRFRQSHVAVPLSFAAVNVEQHAFAVDIGDLKPGAFHQT